MLYASVSLALFTLYASVSYAPVYVVRKCEFGPCVCCMQVLVFVIPPSSAVLVGMARSDYVSVKTEIENWFRKTITVHHI